MGSKFELRVSGNSLPSHLVSMAQIFSALKRNRIEWYKRACPIFSSVHSRDCRLHFRGISGIPWKCGYRFQEARLMDPHLDPVQLGKLTPTTYPAEL